MADKCIGKLTLDITDISKKLDEVNKALAKLGVDAKIDLSSKVSAEVKKQLDSVQKEIEKGTQKIDAAATKAAEAIEKIGSARASSKESDLMAKIEQKVLAAENKMQAEADKTVAKMEANAAKEAAAAEKAEARKLAAREKTERQYEAMWKRAEIQQQASEERQAAATARATQKREDMYKQMFDRIAKEEQKSNQQKTERYTLMFIQQEEAALNSIVAKYKEYFEWKTKATNAEASGNNAGAGVFNQNAHNAYDEIQRLAGLYPDLIKVAEASDEVTRAQSSWLNAITSSSAKDAADEIKRISKESEQAVKDYEQAIKDYANALTALYKEQTSLNNSMASGRIAEGSEEYEKVTEKIKRLEEEAIAAGSNLDKFGVMAANGMSQVKDAADNLVQSQARLDDSGQINYLNRAEQAYRNLTTAIKNYTTAYKSKDTEKMDLWQNEINNSMAVLNALEKEINDLNIDANVRSQIVGYINQAKTQQEGLEKTTEQTTSKTNDLQSAVNGIVTRYLSLFAVIREVKKILGDMINYATEYYDKMNEIQVITGKNSSEIKELGNTYRELANEMHVSSLDIADAAIYFTRQGLAAEEIEKRLKNVTMYAKTANVEFTEAAELITAVVNSMGLVEQEAEDGRNATQRVADVFLAVGDNAATSGYEIGQAMQKAAASAGTFGVEFEWLSASIAAVSATTRQEARTIGTAFNTIIARLHQIKQNGYNQEDETKINDVAKALRNIDVALLDQEGNWRDYQDIMTDVATVWDTLDDKTKSYIATTMAGVKQQNVFFAWMNDMSKSVEEGSLTWDLYAKAIDSAGTAEQKYETYMDSFEAAQNKMNVSLELFYTTLVNNDFLKDLYRILRQIIDAITSGTKAMSGLNIILPVIIGLIVTITLHMKQAAVAAAEMATAMTFTASHPVMLGIMAMIAAFTLLTGIASSFEDTMSGVDASVERFENATKRLKDSTEKLKALEKLQDDTNSMFAALEENVDDTSESFEDYNDILDELVQLSPEAKKAVDDLKNGLIDEKEAADILNDSLSMAIENYRYIQSMALAEKYRNIDVNTDLYPQQSEEEAQKTAYAIRHWVERFGHVPESSEELKGIVGTLMQYQFSPMAGGSIDSDDRRNFLTPLYSDVLTPDLKTEIVDLLKSANKGYIFDVTELFPKNVEIPEEMINIITQMIWSQMFAGTQSGSGGWSAQAVSVVQQAIDEVVSVIGQQLDLDAVGTEALRKKLFNQLFGTDGDLSYEEYQNYANNIYLAIMDLVSNGFEMSDTDIIRTVANSALGDQLGEAIVAEIIEVAKDHDLVDAISQAYQELLGMGFTRGEIRDLYQSESMQSPLNDWADAVEKMRKKIIADIRKDYSEVNPEGTFPIEELFGVKFDDIDITTAKIISDLLAVGTSYSDLTDAIDRSTSIETLDQNLKDLQSATDGLTFENVVKNVKSAQKEIGQINDVLTDIKDGKKFDLMGLADAHPGLLALANDTKMLQEALAGIREADVNNIAEQLRKVILETEDIMLSSPFSGLYDEKNHITSLADIQDMEGVEDYINNAIAATLYNSELLDYIGEDIRDGLAYSITVLRRNLVKSIRKSIGSIVLADLGELDLDTGERTIGTDYMEDFSFETLNLMQELIKSGTTAEEFGAMWKEAGEDVKKFAEILTTTGEEVKEAEEEAENIVEQMKTAEKEIANLDKILDNIKNGDAVDFSDLLDLTDAHPEIIGTIGDISKLEAALDKIKQNKVESVIGDLRSMIMSDPGALESYLAEYVYPRKYKTEDMKTLTDLSKANDDVKEDIEDYVDQMIGVFLYSSGMLGDVGEEWGKNLLTNMFDEANMDLLNRKVVQAKDMVAAGWTEVTDGYATMYSSTFTGGNTNPRIINGKETMGAEIEAKQNVIVSATPILPDGTVLSPEAFDEYITKLIQENEGNAEDILTQDATPEMGGLNLVVRGRAVTDDQSFEDAVQQETVLMKIIHEIHEMLYGEQGDTGEPSWLEKQVQAAKELDETNWAKSNGYVEQIGEMNRALTEGGMEEAYAVWDKYSYKMKEAIVDEYPAIAKAMLDIENALEETTDETDNATEATEGLSSALKKAKQYATAKQFTSIYDAVKKLEKGTISASDAYEVYQKELDKVIKANEDIIDVQSKMANKTEYTVSDVSNLASILGISAEEIMADFPGAVAMFDELISSTGDLQAAIEALNSAAFIKITGMSEADFSAITDGLYAIQADAQDTIDMLVATGQWEITSVDLDQIAKVWDPKSGKWLTMKEAGQATVLKPKATNPFAKGRGSKTLDKDTSGSKKSGGGGGGGGSDKSGPTEVEIMLDRMDQTNAIREYQQSYYQAQKNYYNQNGLLQGVIGYSQREIDVLKEQSKELEANVAQIEKYMDAKRKELASLSTSDERYEEVADDLDKLQKAHQNYTKQLVENKTSIDELTEAIEEQRKKIRQMEIDLRNTILKAIEDREARNEKMFKAEIEMENTILDLIKKRYEKERDEIIENTNLKIDSLNKEKSMLEEQLQLRKQQAEEEDKVKQLRQYESQYQRILADPTRRKEALELEEKIRDLREEMAWDAAEKEVKAQQDSIDQQVESLEDYIEYVENYYEDLFEHPKKLIEEMKELLTMTDAEIIEWLKANDEEYAKSTENTQLMMVQSWQATMDDIHDIIKTYWEEVEYIITQGDEYIIEFLKDNSEEYRKAGKLQAEAYVDEWKEQLENLKKAYKQVATEAASTYSTIAKSTASGKSSGGGGGGGGGSNTTDTEDQKTAAKKYWHVHGTDPYGRQTVFGTTYNTKEEAQTVGKREVERQGWSNLTYSYYKHGGLIDYTGPAWVDGSPSMPEGIMNPYQTKLFQIMVDALDSISRVSVTGMPNYSNAAASGSSPVSVGDIIVNVDNLDTDDDYEELADKVSEVLMDRIGKTAVVGGLRIRSI